ncbi:MAG: hypothetical protein ABIW76_01990 [Fibrobacteria bacterium]
MYLPAKARMALTVAIMTSGLMMTGCLTDDKESDSGNVKISDLKVTPASIKAGQSADVEGTVTSKSALTGIAITVWKGSTEVTTGKGFTVAMGALGADKKAWSLKTDGVSRISVGGAAATGEYTVKVVARSGMDSVVEKASLTVSGTLVTTEELTLGSNQNSNGGSVDLDDLKVYTHSAAKDISPKIDLYYAHALVGGDKLFTPYQAKLSQFGETSNGPATWTTANDTEFRKLTLSESAFAAISTQEAIDALWSTGVNVTGGSDAVAEGSTYIVNTDQAKKVLIRVTAYVEGDTGTITIKGTK